MRACPSTISFASWTGETPIAPVIRIVVKRGRAMSVNNLIVNRIGLTMTLDGRRTARGGILRGGSVSVRL